MKKSKKRSKKSVNRKNVLRVGTDCSGIEAPIQALQQMNISFRHVFSSEIDKYCIESIKANYNPEIIFGDKDGLFPEGDITKRDINDVPDIDLYVCGFPCQPFSMAGQRKGLKDKRGNVFFSCLEVIEIKQPKYFVLENVKNLISHDKGNTWNIMCKYLSDLGKYGYIIEYKILNTCDYGIPQNRERLFIIGSKKKFEWPKYKKMNKLEKYIDNNDSTCRYLPERIIKSDYMSTIPKNSIVVDFSFYGRTNYPNSDKICSCILKRSELWNVSKSRYMNNKELLMLQGFDKKFKQVVSNSQLKNQIGNSMSVNVLISIFNEIL
jgi:DNA (cytosine-5)-methyltransferase 1